MRFGFSALSLFALLLLVSHSAVAQSRDARTDQVVRLMKNLDRGALQGLVVERLFEFQFNEKWWSYMLEPEPFNDGRKELKILAQSVTTMAKNMGWGDLNGLNSKTGNRGDSPLLEKMVDSWKDKIHVTVSLQHDYDDKSLKQTLDNIDYLGFPIQSQAKPRAGKFYLHISLDPNASDLKGSVSADGATYTFVLPTYASYSQGKAENVMKLGH